jgi:hypothetical protein
MLVWMSPFFSFSYSSQAALRSSSVRFSSTCRTKTQC